MKYLDGDTSSQFLLKSDGWQGLQIITKAAVFHDDELFPSLVKLCFCQFSKKHIYLDLIIFPHHFPQKRPLLVSMILPPKFLQDCFSGSSQIMQDYIHKWLQQKRFRGLVEFPLPPSPLHAVYRVRVDCLPMLIYQDELEDAVVQFFAKLQLLGPKRYWIVSDWVTRLYNDVTSDGSVLLKL